MEEHDRSKIISNLDVLSQKINQYDRLRTYFKERRVLNDVMIREIEKHNENEETKTKRLLTKLTKRGPHAFLELKNLCYIYFPDAVKVLDPNMKNLGHVHDVRGASMTKHHPIKQNPINTDHVRLTPFLDPVTPHKSMPPFKFATKEHHHHQVQTYNMRSKHRGVLFFVNIINFDHDKEELDRKGAEVDKNNLIWVFRNMGFTIFYYEDLLFHQLNELLEQFVNSEYLRHTDCLVFSLMTHGSVVGDDKEYVQFPDGGQVNIQKIISHFHNNHCVLLQNKPKVFILPFCRGNRPDRGVTKTTQTDGFVVKSVRNLPTKSDILICYGTVAGFQSHRDIMEGSWFVQALCQVMAQHAHNTDLEVMLKLVTAQLVNEYRTETMHLQTPEVVSCGFKYALFFNPGYISSN